MCVQVSTGTISVQLPACIVQYKTPWGAEGSWLGGHLPKRCYFSCLDVLISAKEGQNQLPRPAPEEELKTTALSSICRCGSGWGEWRALAARPQTLTLKAPLCQ